MKEKKILLAVTGSIAAYKTALLIRLLVKAGAEVKVVMTSAATEFISPLTLSTLSRNDVLTDLADEKGNWANHVMLGRWADVMLVAPASCNTIAKMANGICDNILQAVYLSATCPVWICPAMDEDMWKHASTKLNLDKLSGYGNKILHVNSGELASGLSGEGRMAEPEEIFRELEKHFSATQQLTGRQVLITAGPTVEAIDPVRFISNHSTGKMGIALAAQCAASGAEVVLVLGPTSEKVPNGITTIHVKSASEMLYACEAHFDDADIAIMSAAVADYTPEIVSDKKIKKSGGELTISLRQTVDILKTLGARKKPNQILVGFALETDNEEVNALKKLESKNADLLVLNSLNDTGAGFGHTTNKITIFDKKGGKEQFDLKPKAAVALDIVNAILKYTNA